MQPRCTSLHLASLDIAAGAWSHTQRPGAYASVFDCTPPQGLPGLFAGLAVPHTAVSAVLTKLKTLHIAYTAALNEPYPVLKTMLNHMPWSLPQLPVHHQLTHTER